jgi:hypothetical protein
MQSIESHNGKHPMTIAQTILAQLGGNRFIAMTGAKCSADTRALIVKLPRSAVVVIELTPADLYKVKFGKLATMQQIFKGADAVKWKSEHDNVYADSLRALFEENTGLATSL